MSPPDRKAVRRAFRRAAEHYAGRDFLHAEIRARLLERLRFVDLAVQTAVDLGAGPPAATADLAQLLPDSRIIAIDSVAEMLGTGVQPWIRLCAEATRLPLATGSVDLVSTGMLLHWCDDPLAVLGEIRRILRFPGLLLFSTLGPDTLQELRAAWSQVDGCTHTLHFTDMHDIGDALIGAGFREPVVECERITVTYRDIRRLVTDLRAVGATDLGAGRRRSLTPRGHWNAMLEAYEKQRHAEGVLPVTAEVICGHAWTAPHRRDPDSGDVEIPLDRLPIRRRVP